MGNTESVIRNSEPVDLGQDTVIIENQYKKFKASTIKDLYRLIEVFCHVQLRIYFLFFFLQILSNELELCEPRIHSLQEAAVQLLDRGGPARERLNSLRLRLLGMRRLVKVYLLRLGAVLGNESIEALDKTLMNLSQEVGHFPAFLFRLRSFSHFPHFHYSFVMHLLNITLNLHCRFSTERTTLRFHQQALHILSKYYYYHFFFF